MNRSAMSRSTMNRSMMNRSSTNRPATRLSRRRFLQGLGATAGLSALALCPRSLRLGQSQARAQDGTPKRLITFFTGQDHLYDLWVPPGDPGPLSALSPMMAPLTPYADRILQLHGAHGRAGHFYGTADAFTGTTGREDLPRAFPTGPSLDQLFAQTHLGEVSTPSLQLGMLVGSSYESVISYLPGSGGALPIPLWPQADPRSAFDRVFSAQSPEAAAARWRAGRSILDHSRSQLEDLGINLGEDERRVLDSHLSSVRELERRLGDSPSSGPARSCEAPAEPGGELAPDARLRAHLDITVAALSCDLTRTVSLVLEPGQAAVRFPWIRADGVADDEWIDWHEISHGGASPRTDSGAINKRHLMHQAIQSWHAEQFAYLIAALDAVPEGDGTLLDHTMVVWLSELGLTASGQGNPHLRSDTPLLIAGGNAWSGLRMGHRIDLGGDAHYHDVLLTLGQSLGLDFTTFGEMGTAPVAEMRA